MDKIPENVRLIINSTAPLIVVIILFVIVGQFGISKVLALRGEITQAQLDGNTLSQKLSILQEASATSQTNSNIATTTLPDKNPTLAVLAQLKILASQNSVAISNIKGGATVTDDSGLGRTDISFDATGSLPQLVIFLKGVDGFAPITHSSRIKLNETGGSSRAEVTVSSYFAPFPTKLPAVTDQITDLTSDEKNTLQKITTLTQPVFVNVPASQNSGKPDPFSQ